jgi:hypothetical protein
MVFKGCVENTSREDPWWLSGETRNAENQMKNEGISGEENAW